MGAAFSPFVIAAAVATAGFWTYQLIWSTPESLSAVTSEAPLEAKRQAAADAEAKLKAAEAEQQRLRDEVQRLTNAAANADAKSRAAAAALPAGQPGPTVTTGLFTIRSNTEAWGVPADNSASVSSISECEQRCAQSVNCKVFTYDRRAKMCHPISRADFKPNQNFDSGIRN
jgi:hypothetical protein